nr:phosphopantetheine-binding protein [uncultured Caldimonas sp.]
MTDHEKIAAQVERVIRATLRLKDDVMLRRDANLVEEVGMDSIEAFESVATLHDLLGARIPDRLDPKSLSTIDGIATYVGQSHDAERVQAFLALNVDERLTQSDHDDLLI